MKAPALDEPGLQEASGDPLTAARLGLLAGLGALGALATNIMLPAFPEMARELGVLPRDLAWTLSSFFITFAIGQLFVGPMADAVGRAPLVLGGLVVFVAGSILCAIAPSLPLLIAGRVVQALGPIGTAIALEPFGHHAGIASALLGFLQMGCAAIGTALIGAMPLSPNAAFAVVSAGGTILAAATFLPVVGR